MYNTLIIVSRFISKVVGEVELPGGSTCSWESYPHDSQGESKAKLKQRFTDLTKDNVS